jgi:N-terminal double-transmembrane domain
MGLLAPWFLGGLAALGIPVFVHLLRKHVTVPRPVSSLMFFERGTQSSTRHRKLRYLLLFMLRFTLVLLIVLAFANPFVRRAAADANGRLLLIVLDNSFSMGAANHFDLAKQQALAVLAQRPHGSKAQIIALGGGLDVLTQPIADDTQLRATIESIRLGDGRANFGDLGRSLRAMSETLHNPIDLHLFSDLQRTGMPPNFADMVLPGNATLYLHSMSSSAPLPNWTVESVDAPAELADPKDPRRSRVRAVIAGFNTPIASKSISLLVNGRTLSTRNVEVPANGRATLEFAPLDVGYGFNRCEVRIDDGDSLTADNAAHFSVRRSDPERVLFVHNATDTRSPVYFGAALQAATPSSFILQSVSADKVQDFDPSKFAFVVLSDTPALPPIFANTLQQYVARGGNVLVTLGTSAAQSGRVPLWGSNVAERRNYAQSGAPSSVGRVDFSYPPLTQTHPGRDNGGWSAVKVLYASVVNPAQARVAAWLSDGTPLMLDKQSGEGHILLLTSGLDNLTNDLPLHPVFVAFVDRAARYLSGDDGLSGSRLVDSYIQLRSIAQSAGSLGSVEVIDPAGKRPLSLDEALHAQSIRLERAGFYHIRFASGRDAVIGVNADRRESDLQPMPDDVQKLWSGNPHGGSTANASASVHEQNYRPVSLWWYVMLFVLIVVVAETFVASSYLGTQREEA